MEFAEPVAQRFVPFERIDGDVDLGIDLALGPAAAERLADVEHRSLVALALADDDRAAHLEPVQLLAHRLDGHLIGVLPLAVAHRARRSDGRFFRDTQKTDLETGFHDAPFVAKFGGATLAEYSCLHPALREAMRQDLGWRRAAFKIHSLPVSPEILTSRCASRRMECYRTASARTSS